MKINYEEFDELAALYVLDALDAESRQTLEQQLAQQPQLRLALSVWEESLAALSYAAPPVEPAMNLKDRLMTRIADLAQIVRHHELVWQPYLTAGMTIATLHLDHEHRVTTVLLRAEPGVDYPDHRHHLDEEIFMLDGELHVGPQVFRQGDYFRSASGQSHAPATPTGCTLLIHTSLDDDYASATPIADEDPPYHLVRATEQTWFPHPLSAGVQVAPLYTDAQRGETVCLLKAEPGAKHPAHSHSQNAEEIYMLEGDLSVNGQILNQGDYLRSAPGSVHTLESPSGCIAFLRTFPDEFVEAAADRLVAC